MHRGNTEGLPEREIFVIPGDLELLVSRWIKSTDGKLYRPSTEFFTQISNNLVKALQDAFEGNVEIIFLSWQNIQLELSKIVAEFRKENDIKKLVRPIIGLDPVYSADLADISFDTNRIEVWNPNTNKWYSKTRGERPGSLSIIEQRQKIVDYHGYKDINEGRRALVLDDVTWKRGTLHSIEEILKETLSNEDPRQSIAVDGFIVAFEVDKSVVRQEKFPKAPIVSWKKFGGKQIDYDTGDEYFEIVHDIVSERDFFPGVPYSGRTSGFENKHFISNEPKTFENILNVYKSSPYKSNYGAPYVAPLGYPIKWANIPEKSALRFSELCLSETINLYEEIQSATELITKEKVNIKIGDLPRPPYHLVKNRVFPDGKDPREEGIVGALKNSIEFLKNNPNSCL